MQPNDERVLATFESRALHRAFDAAGGGFGGENAAGSVAGLARLRHVLQMALANALPGHLDQAKVAHRECLGPGPVAAEVRAELLQHLVAVRLRLHVDEVADDDDAEIAEARLAGDSAGLSTAWTEA